MSASASALVGVPVSVTAREVTVRVKPLGLWYVRPVGTSGVEDCGEGVGEGAGPSSPLKGVREALGVPLALTLALNSPALYTLLATVRCTRKEALSRGMPRPCAARLLASAGLTKAHRSSSSTVASTGLATSAGASAVTAMACEVVSGRGGKKSGAGRLPLPCSCASTGPAHVSPASRATPAGVSWPGGTARGPTRAPSAVRPAAPTLRRKA